MTYYHRKEPTLKRVDLLLRCGCTVVAEYDPDKEEIFKRGDVRFCKKHREIETVKRVTPWSEIIIPAWSINI